MASIASLAAAASLAILFLASCFAASRTSWAIEPTPLSSADCASTGLVEASIASVAALASASTAFLEASFSASDKFGLASIASLAAATSLAILFLASCLAASRTSSAMAATPASSSF